MDHVAVHAHPPQSRSHGDRLVRHDPDSSRESLHLHGEPHRGVHCTNAPRLQTRDNGASYFAHAVAGMVKFQIRHRTGRAAYRLSIHPAHEADQRPSVREDGQDRVTVPGQFRPLDLDEAHVVRTGLQTHPTQPLCVEWSRAMPLRNASGLRPKTHDRGMLV